MDLQQVLQALRNADAAGDVEGARRLAQIAQQLSSQQAAPVAPAPKGGFVPAMQAGWENLKGDVAALAGRTGLITPEEAERARAGTEAEAQRIYKPTEKGWLEAPVTKVAELAGGSLPYMAAPLAAGAGAAYAGAPALAATGIAGLTSAAQFTGSNLSRQIAEGTPLAKTSLGGAAAAAVPQAALDMIGFKMMPGIRGIFKAAGKDISEEAAKKIAQQSLGQAAKDYALTTGKAMGAEGLTEAGQQVLERMQAGLNLTDPQARQEYFDSLVGGAVLGGVVAPAGRYVERGRKQEQERQQEQVERSERVKQAQVQAEADIRAQQAKYQDPEYAQRVAQEYRAAEEQFQRLRDATRVAKDAPMADKLAAKQAQEDLKAFVENELKPKAAEYNKVKGVLPAETAEAPAVQPPAEGGLFPEAPVPTAPEKDLLGRPVLNEAREVIPSAQDVVAQHADYRRKISNLTDALEEQRGRAAVAAQAGDIDIAAEEAKKFKDMEKALQEMQAEVKKLPPEPKAAPTDDALNKQLAAAQQRLRTAGDLGDIEGIQRAANKIAELRRQNPGLFTKESVAATAAVDQQLADDIAAGREQAAQTRTKTEQEAAALRGWSEKEPGYAGEARKERQTQLEIEELERGRMNTGAVEQGALFPEETGAGVKPAEETMLAKRDTLVQQLAAARRAEDRKAADAALEQLRRLKESEPEMLRDRLSKLQTAYQKAKKDGRDTAALSRAISSTQQSLQKISGAGLGSEEAAEVAPVLAGTNKPTVLPKSAESVAVERTMAGPAGLKDVRAELTRADTPLARTLLDTPAFFAQPEALRDAAEYARRARIGQESSEVEQRIADRMALLEKAKQTDEKAPADMFPDTEMQGAIFDTPEQFMQFLASDALADTRKAVGLALKTAARAKQELAPMEAQLADLRESIGYLQTMLAATKRTGAEKIERAQEAHAKALARVRDLERALDEKMRPAQAAVVAADLELSKAQGARAKVLDSIAKNQTKFSPDVKVQEAADAAAKAQQRYKDGLSHGGHSQAHMDGLATEAKTAAAAHRTALARASNPLDRSVLAFLNKDMELQLRLADAQTAVDTARSNMDGARAQLDAVEKEIKESVQAQAALRVNKRNEAHARGVVTKAVGSTERTVEKTAKELQALDDQRQQLEQRIRAELAPIEAAQAERVAPAMEETQAQREARDAAQRKEETARTERLGAIPGRQVSYEDFRKALDKLQKLPERIRDVDAKAKDETLPEATRKKAKYEAQQLRNEASFAFNVFSNDPERVAVAKRALDNEVETLQTKIADKKAAVLEPGKSKSTISSRRKELSEMQSKLREFTRLQKQLAGRAKVTPILTPTERAARAEDEAARQSFERGMELEIAGATGRLPARKIGPVLKKTVVAGNIRTGELGTVSERTLSPRNKPEQGGKTRGVTGTQAVRQAGRDTAQEQALLELSKIEGMQEQTETALELAQEAGDEALIAKYEGFQQRLERAHEKAQRQLNAAVKAAPSVLRAGRVSTSMPSALQDAVQDGRMLDAADMLATMGWPFATKLSPLLRRTKIRMDAGVQYEGASVAGLYDPASNTITMHPEAFVEDLVHEMTHAATDTVLLSDPQTLTPAQREARTALENMQKALNANPAFAEESIGNVREFVAEVMSNPDFQAKMDGVGSPLSLLDRFKNILRRLFGMAPVTPTGKARDLIDEILMPSRKLEGAATPSAAQALAGDIIAQPQGFRERYSKNLGLSAEMWAVDMRAPLMKALGAAGERAAAQASYLVRKADARMSHTYAALSQGPLQLKKDVKGFVTIEAGNGPNAKEIFTAVSKMPGKDAAGKMALAQVYLTAKRAARVGWDKLGFDPQRMADLKTKADAMMAEVNADPQTKAALEEVSRLYNEYNKGLIGFLASSGALPKAKAAELLKHGDYVPFYRVLGNGTAELVLGEGNVYAVGNIRNQPYLKELKGGDQRLLPLNDALVRNTMLLTDMGMRNLATKDVAYALQAVGKDVGAMRIRKGPGDASPNTIRFRQEPDVNDPKDDGERHVVIDTAGTVVEGIPADMLAHSMEGSFAALPAFLKVAGWFGDVLRSGVTRNPLYIARQLVRDPMAASMTAGLDAGPVTGMFKSMAEFTRQMSGRSATADTLLKKGLVHSNIFTGDADDMAKFSLQLAKGDQSAYHKLLAFWDAAAMRADASTRAQLYDDAIKKGMSEMEAEFAAMEMMNFNKRGVSPTVQFAARMIPFFNAQIQGLNVLYKAATGQMPADAALRIREKFYKRALVLSAMTLIYAAAMDDDEAYKNARPRDRYSNFFLPNPTGGEHIKLPIPFEVGLLFKAMPEALLDVMKGRSTEQEWKAVKQMLVQQIPGATSYGVPQIARPALEVMSNANWFTGREIETAADKRLLPYERFGKNTSELAKQISSALDTQPIEGLKLSPKQIEHLTNGYLGSLPVAVARMTNALFAAESVATTPESRGSDLPVFGTMFQREFGGGPVDAAYAQAQAIEQAGNTYKKLLEEGRVAQAAAFRENAVNVIASPELAKRFTTQMAQINKAETAIRRFETDPVRMRQRLDQLDKQRNDFAKMYLQAVASLAK